MKSSPAQVTPAVVLPTGEMDVRINRRTRSRRISADPTHRFHPPGASHDDRRDVAAGKAPQRLRARQTEPRVAEQCHIRKPRHP
jgi:hypothetical protein